MVACGREQHLSEDLLVPAANPIGDGLLADAQFFGEGSKTHVSRRGEVSPPGGEDQGLALFLCEVELVASLEDCEHIEELVALVAPPGGGP